MVGEPERLLTIGAFAHNSRLSPKALRLYESSGLLVPATVDRSNGYRRYAESQLRDARVIRLLRRIDMPLATVAEVLAAPREERSQLVQAFWTGVEDQLVRRRRLADHLRNTLSEGREWYPMYEIKVREVPEQTVVTEQAHVVATALPEWIRKAGHRQFAALQSVGGAVGPAMVIYHGEVSEDSDGPVEMCSPVDPARISEIKLPTRVEPAHREAFTTIAKDQVRYPDILSAYDAVDSWITERGEKVAGSPREVYFADFENAAADDLVADIAFPIVVR